MQFTSTLLAAAIAFTSLAEGHMSIVYPPPFRSKANPNTKDIDYEINSPITGSQFPCKGVPAPGSPGTESVATLTPGSTSKITFSGGAAHEGGSCQVSLSYDNAKTFKVIHSWIGGCPVSEGTLEYTVPADTPSGAAIFAWTWINKVGNRELYMNCASVTIAGGKQRRAAAVSFDSRPDIFVANIGTGVTVPEGIFVYPNPGPAEDVTGGSVVGGGGSGSGDGNGNGGGVFVPPTPPASTAPAATTPAPTPSGSPESLLPIPPSGTASDSPPAATATGSAPAPSGTAAPGTLTESTDGTCGAAAGTKCRAGFYCSAANFCGDSAAHKTNCQAAFGDNCATFPISDTTVVVRRATGTPFPVGVAGRIRL